MKVRRVVTGHDANGKAIVASDGEVDGFRPALVPGEEFHTLWVGDEAPRFPDDGAMGALTTFFPPIGGFRFWMFTRPPDGDETVGPPDDPDAAEAEFEANLPGLPGYMEPDAGPGMHTTDSIDFELVLDGEIWLELDDGVEVHLKAGDTVVQNGTRHAWHNRGTVPCRLAVFVVGAHHERVTRPS